MIKPGNDNTKKEFIQNELDDIKMLIEMLERRVINLEKEIKLSLDNASDEKSAFNIFDKIEKDEQAEDDFINYLLVTKKLSKKSIENYFVQLKKVPSLIKSIANIKLPCEMYQIGDLDKVDKIRELIFSDKDFINENRMNHHQMSAAINNYVNFLENRGIEIIDEEEW